MRRVGVSMRQQLRVTTFNFLAYKVICSALLASALFVKCSFTFSKLRFPKLRAASK